MATVELIYDVKTQAWFDANSDLLLSSGEPAYRADGKYKIGDGTTTLANLPFIGDYCHYVHTSDVTVSNTIVETTLLQSAISFPANFFHAGKQLVIRLRGLHSSAGNPNIRCRIKLGGTTVMDTGNNVSGNSTNNYWDIDALLCCRTAGATGTFRGQGIFIESNGQFNHFDMVSTADTTLDTTAALTFDITIEWGSASVNNTITTTNGYIQILENK